MLGAVAGRGDVLLCYVLPRLSPTATRPRRPMDKAERMSHEAVNWAYDQDLGAGAALSSRKFVLVTLADHANERGICWPSHGRLAKRVGLHRSSIARLIDELEFTHRVIHTTKVKGKVSIVTLHLPSTAGREWGEHPSLLPPVAPCDTSDPVDNVHYLSHPATPHLLHPATPPRASDATPPRASDAARTIKNRQESPARAERVEHTVQSGAITYTLDDDERSIGRRAIDAIREGSHRDPDDFVRVIGRL